MTYYPHNCSCLIPVVQRSVRIRLDIPKTASYRLLFYYILDQSEAETGDLILTRVGGGAGQLSEKVTFLSSGGSPGYYTVGGSVRPTSFLLSEGQWDMELAIPQSKLLLVRVVSLFSVLSGCFFEYLLYRLDFSISLYNENLVLGRTGFVLRRREEGHSYDESTKGRRLKAGSR